MTYAFLKNVAQYDHPKLGMYCVKLCRVSSSPFSQGGHTVYIHLYSTLVLLFHPKSN
jgi:hypothetical protein